MPSGSILSVCAWIRWSQTAEWCKYIDNYVLTNICSFFSHFPRTLEKLHLAPSTLTTRPFPASSGRRPVNASSVRAAHSTMSPTRRDALSTHCLTFLKVLRYHPCLKNSRKHATIINIRIIITATILQATVTIPLIMLATTHINSIFHQISTWATILANKTQWFK